MDVCKWGHYLFVPDTTSLAWERQLGKKKKKKKVLLIMYTYVNIFMDIFLIVFQ